MGKLQVKQGVVGEIGTSLILQQLKKVPLHTAGLQCNVCVTRQ